MSRRRPAGKLDSPRRQTPAAKPPTYVMHAEPGHFELAVAKLDVVGFWLRRVFDLTGMTPPEALEPIQDAILTGLDVLRGGHVTNAEMQAAAEGAIVAALAIGFYHSGSPADAEAIEKQTRRQGTAAARAELASKKKQVEGTIARKVIRRACYNLWQHQPDILDHHAYVKVTIRGIHSEVVNALRPHIAEGSLWAQDAEGLDGRMANHVRAARGRFGNTAKQIP